MVAHLRCKPQLDAAFLLGTDTPGAREAVRVTGMGLIVPPRDPVALGEGIARVLERRAEYVKPHADIAAAYSLEETLDRNERLFREAAT